MFSTVALSPVPDLHRPPAAPTQKTPVSGEPLAPLSDLLIDGGDERIGLLPNLRVNSYGCTPHPRTDVAEFASSTATTISEHAYEAADRARTRLAVAAERVGLEAAVDDGVEAMRRELRRLLTLDAATEIVFAPSGTDAALLGMFLAAEHLGPPFTNIMMGPDETGSGVPYASLGRHFSSHTALGVPVRKGEAVLGFPRDVASASFAARSMNGRPLRGAEIDEAVLDLVRRGVSQGRGVILNAMDCSRTGLTGPSFDCLDYIAAEWPYDVLVVVDACQMRLSRADLRRYLDRNFMVVITGSKFFTGPPFSGALLVPKALSDTFARTRAVPAGLKAYTSQSSWPRRWSGIRAGLGSKPNLGEWVRWEAALEEMRAYFAVPDSFRAASLRKFAAAVGTYLSDLNGIEAADDVMQEDEAGLFRRSIVPFYLTRHGRPLTQDEALRVYRRMNDDIAYAEPDACHLGQPVALNIDDGLKTGAFRASLSARMVSQSWVAGDPSTSDAKLDRELDRLGAALEKAAYLAAQDTE